MICTKPGSIPGPILYCLDVEHAKRWRAYLDGLTENGLSREPAR
jgi:hypothetical protein